MKISIEWINSYLSSPVTADDAVQLLTHQSFPIDSREEIGDGDSVIDVEVTSNRPDCLSHIGLARELAVATGATLQLPEIVLPEPVGEKVTAATSVDNSNPQLCPVYTARVIRGVKVGPSPQWLVRRVEAIGLRSVNNIVDVTNYVLHETGQPLHAFDLPLLQGQRIVVRCARDGEAFTAIDGTKHRLDSSMLVIADSEVPVAVAGVMGGLESEVTEKTTDILLESARFNQLSVRQTSRRLKLKSDSSYRFERGVDPAGVDHASRRAAQLIIELAGGQLCDGVIRVGEDLPQPRKVTMRIMRCNQLLGISLKPDQMVDYLARLELQPQQEGDRITCTIPTFRLDLQREVDLIEEISRVHGFDDIPIMDKMPIVARPVQDEVAARRKLGEVLVAHGFHETINFSFIAPKLGQPFILSGHEPVTVDDERRKAEPMLRPSSLPSLLACRKRNQDGGNHDVKIFETAAVWNAENGKIIEHQRLGLLADAQDAHLALRQVRSTVDELIVALKGQCLITIEPSEVPYLSTSATIAIEGQRVGTFGLVNRQTQELFDLQAPVVVAELDLPRLLADYPPLPSISALPRFPGIERDLSIAVDENVSWSDIEMHVADAQPALLESVRFITTYRGKPIPKGHKSVSFRMLFRDPNKTLRHDEVDPQVWKVIHRLKEKTNAELRE